MAAVRILNPGPVNRIKHAFDGTIAVEVGDLMFHDSNDVKPFSSLADQGSSKANQAYAAKRFAGVAGDTRTASDTEALTIFPVDTDIVVEIDCVSNTFEVDDYVAPTEDAGADGLENTKVEKTTNPDIAIGQVVEREGSAVTRVVVRLLSRTNPHAIPQAVSSISAEMAFGDFTDGGATAGTFDFTDTLPAGAIVLGWDAVVDTGFTGDTSAVVRVGVNGDDDDFSADTTQSVFAAGTVGSKAQANDAGYVSAAVAPRVTVTSGADFTSVAAGQMTVTVYYIATR